VPEPVLVQASAAPLGQLSTGLGHLLQHAGCTGLLLATVVVALQVLHLLHLLQLVVVVVVAHQVAAQQPEAQGVAAICVRP
jgi:hypothetical protein